MRNGVRKVRGFTLIEILVVIAIIGILSTFALIAVNSARIKARDAKVRGDLAQMRTAISLLENATEKWPNGCPAWKSSNPEVTLDNTQAGIASAPSVGDQGDGCEWTSDDIIAWTGPYTQNVTDPWGNPYLFDPDYTPYENCGSKTTLGEGVFIVSYGPNGVGLNAYDCDDIFLQLE